MKILKKTFLAICCVLSIFGLTACKEVKKELVLEATKEGVVVNEKVFREDEIILSAVLKDNKNKIYEAKDVVYEIVSGEDDAELNGNTLIIDADAEVGAEIEVVAKLGKKVSNEIEFEVSVPLEAITISAGGIQNIEAGDSVALTKTLNPSVSDISESDVEWVITQNASICEISNNKLYVNINASTGAIIKVKAQCGDITSNELEFIVGYPLEELTISSVGSSIIKADGIKVLVVEKNPDNATGYTITWEITEGAEYAAVINNNLCITEEPPIGQKIKVKAIGSTGAQKVYSNELEFQYETPITKITLSSTTPEIIMSGNSALLNVSVAPEGASMKDFKWKITVGSEYAQIIDKTLVFKDSTPIGAKVKVKAYTLNDPDVECNELTFQYRKPITKITLSSTTPEIIMSGNSALLNVSVAPEGASMEDFIWNITAGSQFAQIIDKTLVFNASAPYGSIVKVKAYTLNNPDVECNELTFQYGKKLVSISANIVGSKNVKNGSSRPLEYTLNPTDATNANVEWVIVSGEEFGYISNGVITIYDEDEAPVGSKIYVKAVSGDIESDPVEIIVGTPIETITISAVGVEDSILTTRTIPLNVVVTPTGATLTGIEWEITSGAEYASITNNNLIILSSTPIGTTIAFKAKNGEVISNELTFQYGIPVESVTISPVGTLDVLKGTSVGLSVKVNPEEATERNSVVWTIIEGSEYANIIENSLVVKADAVSYETITVKATVGGVDSNELTFTIQSTQEEINASKYFISVSEENINLDINGKITPVLTVEVYNYNFDEITDKNITYRVVEGLDYLDVDPNGYECSFVIKGHGKAVVEVGIEGTNVTERVDVNVIVPPDFINLPEVFEERTGFVYSFSKINPVTSEAEKLPFVVTTDEENACSDFTYSFMHEDGTTGDDVAIWENGEITFFKTGKVTVIVSSDSGSSKEKTVSYSFNINEGFNVYTYLELQKLANKSTFRDSKITYNGQPINIVVLEKPKVTDQFMIEYKQQHGEDAEMPYGYDLVSAAGLKAISEQTFEDVFYGELNNRGNGQRINFVCRNVHINGNNHKINLSQVRPITSDEFEEKKEDGTITTWENFDAVIRILAYHSDEEVILGGAYNVKLYDLEVIGNCSVDFDGYIEGIRPMGVFDKGIGIGDQKHNTIFYIDMKNVTAAGCITGFDFNRIVGNGLAEGLHAYNCFSNGIETWSSIFRIKDVTLGSCGAAGIELVPGYSDKAGENFDQNQKITFEGTINVDGNYNAGNTKYFENYKVQGNTIPAVIQGVLLTGGYDETQISHMKNEKGEFVFVCFVLVDIGGTFAPNSTEYSYPAWQEGGIINAKDLPKDVAAVDTTHQFIELDAVVAGMGDLGKVLLYNHHYQPNNA